MRPSRMTGCFIDFFIFTRSWSWQLLWRHRSHAAGLPSSLTHRGADRNTDANCHTDHVGLCDGSREIVGEREGLFSEVAFDQFFQPGPKKRDLAAPRQPHLDIILVNANDLISRLRKRRADDQLHLSRAHHRNSFDHPNARARNLRTVPRPSEYSQPIDREGAMAARATADSARLPSGTAAAQQRGRIRASTRSAGAMARVISKTTFAAT